MATLTSPKAQARSIRWPLVAGMTLVILIAGILL